MLLSRAERRAALLDFGRVPIREATDELVDADVFAGLDQTLQGNVVVAHPQVGFDRAAKEVDILQHDADVLAQVALQVIADVDTIDQHRAALNVVEAADQTDDAGFARAGRADERDGLAGLNAEIDAAQHPIGFRDFFPKRFVTEPHVLEFNLAPKAAGK